jgi:hypothetical protein
MMTPTEAGFDGAKGISLNMPKGGVYKLRRGKGVPNVEKSCDLRNQLLWVCPDDAEAKLLYCNEDNQLFELSFTTMEP